LPQLLAEREVEEARELFLKNSVHGDEVLQPEDFLEKPVHVALEEKSSTFEELEAFNEQMQEASKPQQQKQEEAAAALLKHSEKAETAAPGAAPVPEQTAPPAEAPAAPVDLTPAVDEAAS